MLFRSVVKPLPPVDASIPAPADNQAPSGNQAPLGNNAVVGGTPAQVVQADNSMPLQSRGVDLQPQNFFRLDTNLPPDDYKSPSKTPNSGDDKPWYNKLSTDQMIRLGLSGALGMYGAEQAKKAARQNQQYAQEQKQLGAPYQQKGAELQRAAAAGELTPAGQQSLQAAAARYAQDAEQRKVVGAAQFAVQLEAYRQQLLQNQYDYGLKVSQIGDNIALGAIRTGMQADQQLNQANTTFYTQLAMIGAGVPIKAA